MRPLIRFLSVLLVNVAFHVGIAQERPILSFDRDGTLTWSNPVTNVYCGFQGTEKLPGGWQDAPPPYWNILVTNSVMAVTLPLPQIQGDRFFLRLVSSANPLPGGETYDLDSNGTPRFVEFDYIESAKIARISRFRSGYGHNYSDAFESCRSMKHYFQAIDIENSASIQIRAPVTGTISRLDEEGLAGSGTQIRIKSSEFPAFYFILFHVQTNSAVAIGNSVSAGQVLGTHIGSQTMSDVAVNVNTPTGERLISYFDVMTDSLFTTYQVRGVPTRSDLIISKEARDADPLTCSGETFLGPGTLPNWVTLQ